MEKEVKWHLLLLLALILATRLAFFSFDRPLIRDEALYAQMTNEFIASPKIIPTYLGQEVAWRPVVYFAVSAPFVIVGNWIAPMLGWDLGIPYRLASVFFGAGAIFVMYFLFKREFSADLAFAACAIFAVSYVSAYVDTSALVDSVLLFFIMLSIYFYFGGVKEGKSGWKGYLLGGILAGVAFWTKTVVAAIIPVIVIAYVLCKKKEEIKNPVFIISLLILPASMLLYNSLFTDASAIGGEYLRNIPNKLISPNGVGESIVGTLREFISFNFLILGPFLLSFWKFWKNEKWLSVWALCVIGTLFVGMGYFWYPLPIMPAICIFFAFMLFEKYGKWRLDEFSWFVLGLLCILVFALSIVLASMGFAGDYKDERAGGLFLAGKEKVLLAGDYMATSLFYKMKSDGLDAPCIVYAINDSHLNESDYWKSNIYWFGKESNYSYNYRLSQMFWNTTDVKIPCGQEKFGWVLASMMPEDFLSGDTNYSLVRKFGGNVSIYSTE